MSFLVGSSPYTQSAGYALEQDSCVRQRPRVTKRLRKFARKPKSVRCLSLLISLNDSTKRVPSARGSTISRESGLDRRLDNTPSRNCTSKLVTLQSTGRL